MNVDELLELGSEVCAAVLNGAATDPSVLELANLYVAQLERGAFVEASSQNDLDEEVPTDPVARRRFLAARRARRKRDRDRARARGEPVDALSLRDGPSRSASRSASRYGHAGDLAEHWSGPGARDLRVTRSVTQSPQSPLIREAEEKRSLAVVGSESLVGVENSCSSRRDLYARDHHAERDVTLRHASRSVTPSRSVTLAARVQNEQPGLSVYELILFELERATGDVWKCADHSFWLRQIAERPADEWDAVIAALRTDDWHRLNPGKCTPAHIMRRWEVYRRGPKRTAEQLEAEAAARPGVIEHLELKLASAREELAGAVDADREYYAAKVTLIEEQVARLKAAP